MQSQLNLQCIWLSIVSHPVICIYGKRICAFEKLNLIFFFYTSPNTFVIPFLFLMFTIAYAYT